MKRLTVIILLIILLCLATYAIAEQKAYLSPGYEGMVSNTDFEGIGDRQSLLIVNGDITESPGKIMNRRALLAVGNNSPPVFAARGFFDFAKGYRYILGVVYREDSLLVGINTGANQYYVFSDSTYHLLGVSDSAATDLSDSIIQAPFVSSYSYDISNMFENTFIAYGNGPPLVYRPEYGARTGYEHATDTAYSRPHAQFMAPPAPGQLVAITTNDTTSGKTGLYRYAYRLGDNANHICGPASNWVKANKQKIMLCGFEGLPGVSSTDTATAYVWRQKYNNSWYQIDSFSFDPMTFVYYLDSTADNSGTAKGLRPRDLYRFGEIYSAEDTIPGAFCLDGVYDSTNTDPTDNITVDGDSVYYFAYSYYDPINDVESPLGPITYGVLQAYDATATDTVLYGLGKSWIPGMTKPRYIRAYRSEMVGSDGSGKPALDPTAYELYGAVQLYAYDLYVGYAAYNDYAFLGWISDSQLVLGFDSIKTSGADYIYYDNDIFRDDNGDVVILPPYRWGCEFNFSDMEYANGRMWGIGDPVYPNRLYYSDLLDYTNWEVDSYFEIPTRPGDRLVGLKALPAGNSEVLYVFRHHDVWQVTGYDAENDLTISLYSNTGGAIKREAIVESNNQIYYMSPNFKVWKIPDNVNVSVKVEDWIDSLFSSYKEAYRDLFAFNLTDKIVWYDTSDQQAMVYHEKAGVWTIETYENSYRPIGSFLYDTTIGNPAYVSGHRAMDYNIYGFPDYSWWTYQSDAGDQFVKEIASRTTQDTLNTDAPGALDYFPSLTYWTPWIGDGMSLWEILKVRMTVTATSETSLELTVFNQNLDTLTIDTVFFGASYETKNYTEGIGPHHGEYLSVRMKSLQVGSGDNPAIEIHDVTIEWERVGDDYTGD